MDGTACNNVRVEYISQIVPNALVFELWLLLLIGARVLRRGHIL